MLTVKKTVKLEILKCLNTADLLHQLFAYFSGGYEIIKHLDVHEYFLRALKKITYVERCEIFPQNLKKYYYFNTSLLKKKCINYFPVSSYNLEEYNYPTLNKLNELVESENGDKDYLFEVDLSGIIEMFNFPQSPTRQILNKFEIRYLWKHKIFPIKCWSIMVFNVLKWNRSNEYFSTINFLFPSQEQENINLLWKFFENDNKVFKNLVMGNNEKMFTNNSKVDSVSKIYQFGKLYGVYYFPFVKLFKYPIGISSFINGILNVCIMTFTEELMKNDLRLIYYSDDKWIVEGNYNSNINKIFAKTFISNVAEVNRGIIIDGNNYYLQLKDAKFNTDVYMKFKDNLEYNVDLT